MIESRFLNRDISWLSFNGRVLQEAMSKTVPLMERLRFLSIFSSNLDEFYRVRMSELSILSKVKPLEIDTQWISLQRAKIIIQEQQEYFGKILTLELIPSLQENNIELLYGKLLPDDLMPVLKDYFQSEIMTFLEIKKLEGKNEPFFAQNNNLYQAVFCENENKVEELIIISIPSIKLSRFFSVPKNGKLYIIFLDDIIKQFIPSILPNYLIKSIWNIKITRDSTLDLADEYEGDLAEKIEKQLKKRDDGNATRFLYETGISQNQITQLISLLKLSKENAVEGGHYHNLKDLGNLPVKMEALNYKKVPSLTPYVENGATIFSKVLERDKIIHTPYQSYNMVLRFFNEAAVDESVKEIYTTLYRVAGDSKIVNALITAAKNGKKVTVFIELKARFDEENNINWSKKMKAAGVNIINSIPSLKVHAKVALIKKNSQEKVQYIGLLATGNLNEITSRFYTDHILFTTHAGIVRELELLFIFLIKRRLPIASNEIIFNHLLVAQFNLQSHFIDLIDVEIANAIAGKESGIILKMNNLEEKVLINKLYEASQAGVKVQLIVRSICCLAPNIIGLSENISIIRIVDRYLEHGRIFMFKNAGEDKIFMGSSDWMNRNIYKRIEVCCPVYDPLIKKQLFEIIQLQLNDNVQAVEVNIEFNNKPILNDKMPIQSQRAIYDFLNY